MAEQQIYPAIILPEWRNWHTRMFQEHIPQGLWVRIPPRAQMRKKVSRFRKIGIEDPRWLRYRDKSSYPHKIYLKFCARLARQRPAQKIL